MDKKVCAKHGIAQIGGVRKVSLNDTEDINYLIGKGGGGV